MSDPLSDAAKFYHDFRNENIENEKIKYRKKEDIDNIMINALEKILKFHVVRVNSYTLEEFNNERGHYSRIANGKEIIVKERSCIKSIKIMR